jgi:hypothetical protein
MQLIQTISRSACCVEQGLILGHVPTLLACADVSRGLDTGKAEACAWARWVALGECTGKSGAAAAKQKRAWSPDFEPGVVNEWLEGRVEVATGARLVAPYRSRLPFSPCEEVFCFTHALVLKNRRAFRRGFWVHQLL